jgi:hypothetical protein
MKTLEERFEKLEYPIYGALNNAIYTHSFYVQKHNCRIYYGTMDYPCGIRGKCEITDLGLETIISKYGINHH